ncbi:pyridoxamine kinase [Clostridium oceanicum]|uniref:pyridoxal kinase n=1 Tax=Clostridium oceanicum TaxID=1543 RepID=A0ABN1JHM7_9CLOT
MKLDLKKVAAIHDISGFGRASLTTVIPIISAMECQVCPVPTAVLSTHTGGFGKPKIVDLTDHIEEYISHWERLNLNFDCIYSGYLGSAYQIDIITNFIKRFKHKDTLVVIDPVMGDDFELYSNMGLDMVDKMRGFIKLADVITPNFTEACYILGKECVKPISEISIKNMLKSLSKFGPDIVIITSVPIKDNVVTTACYDKINDKFYVIHKEKLKANYPGTGDAFTSVIVGSLLKKYSIDKALKIATDFVEEGMKVSLKYDYPYKEGILLEKTIKEFILKNK